MRVPAGCITKPAGSRFYYAGEARFAPTGPQRVGTGAMFYHNGGRYEGNWMGDVQSNLGWSLTPGGEIYVGKWAAGERNGCGLLVGSDGDVYYGQFRQDACSGWGVQQTVDWDETGETIKKGRWELGKHTLKRFRGGVAYYVQADKELPQKEEEQVLRAVADAQTHVPIAIGQVQSAFRAQMRAEDAQLRAMAELDEAADDGTAKELRAFHSKSEASAVESLAGARGRAESGAYLDMANASIQAGIVEHRIAMAKLLPRNYKYWRNHADVAQQRVEDLRQNLRNLRKLAFSQRHKLREAGMVSAAELAAYEAAQLSKAGLSPKKNVRGSVAFADSRVQQTKPQRSVKVKAKQAAARRQAMRSSRDSVASRLSATQSQRWSAKGHDVGTVDSNASSRLGLASDHQRRRSVRSVRSVSSQPSVLPRRSVAGELATDQQRRRSTRISRASQRSLDLRTQQQRRGTLTATGQSREVQRLTRKLNRNARRAANRNRRGTKFAVAVQEAVEFELDSGKLQFRAAASPPVKAVPEESESSLRSSSARSGGVVHNTNNGGAHQQAQRQRRVGMAGSDDEDEPPPIMHPFINN